VVCCQFCCQPSLASGKAVTQFSVATNEYIGQGKEKAEYQCKGKVSRPRRTSRI
jgi:hypothetical protein